MKRKVEQLERQETSSRVRMGIPWSPALTVATKAATLRLAEVYLERTLEDTAKGKKKSSDEVRRQLNAAIEFGFKVHQFVGGFSPQCNELLAKMEVVLTNIRK